ncbi:MAG: radical SAM protein [Candidatus Bathyarchaeia archaeon]
MSNERPAKFRICKAIPCSLDLQATSEDEMWAEHGRLAADFTRLHQDVASDRVTLDDVKLPPVSFLHLKAELLKSIVKHCHLCEWRCRVDRWAGQRLGACKLDATPRVSTWFHHYGEEPPLVGTGGSGTIFFTGCVFRCVFCQNWDISQDPNNGVPVDAKRLALVIDSLAKEGAHNINFVGGEPTPNLHVIAEAMSHVNVNVSMLWNSDMYLTAEAMRILVDVIDIWLPDFKYGNDKCAVRLSKVMRYFPVVSRNHALAQDRGDMIIRHLVLPNHVECCTKPVLKWIAENCPRTLVNIMGQYRPEYLVPEQPEKYPDITRRPTSQEMNEAFSYAEELGILYEPVS